MNQSPLINELFTALSKAQREIRGAFKDAKNPHFKSAYTSLESTWDAVQGPLTTNNLCITQLVQEIAGKYYLVTMLGHSSGQWISSMMPLLSQKNDMQGMGSAITYARRYGLQAILSCPSVDDDGEASIDRFAPPVKALKPISVDAAMSPFIWGSLKGQAMKDIADLQLQQFHNEVLDIMKEDSRAGKSEPMKKMLETIVSELATRNLK